MEKRLQLVFVFGDWRHVRLATLALSDVQHNLTRLGIRVERVAVKHLPVIEDGLRERLARGGRTESTREAEGLHDRQVRLDVVNRRTRALSFFDDHTALLRDSGVNTTKSLLRSLDFDQVDRFEETRFGAERRRIQHTTASRDDLTTTTVNGIGVENDIVDFELDTTHVFFGEDTFLGGPLERRDARILDFVEVLDTLTHVDDKVRASGVRTEAPNLLRSKILVPAVRVSQITATSLRVITRGDITVVNSFSETFIHGDGLEVQAVVLVRRLGHANVIRRALDGFTEGHNRVGDADFSTTHEIFLKILQANFKVKLTGTSNNVLTSFFDLALHHRVRLGEALETFDELREILGVLALNRDAHDRGDRELHRLDRVRFFFLLTSNRRVLLNERVETNHCDGVTARHVVDRVLATAHAQHGTLDGLDVQILLVTRNVVRAHDAYLLASLHGTRENTTKGQETALIGSRNHLGHIQHERTRGIAVADSLGVLVIKRTFVESIDTVLLRSRRGRQVVDNHLKKGDVRRQPSLHNTLHQRLAEQVQISRLQLVLDLELFEHWPELVLVVVHRRFDDTTDRLVAELNEGAHARLGTSVLLRPLLFLRVEEVIAPKLGHHRILVDAELGGIHLGEDSQGEGPVVETGREAHGALFRSNLHVAKSLVRVRRHDNVGVFDHTAEVLVSFFTIEHEFEEAAIELVDSHDGLDAFTERLTKHGFGLHAHPFDAVDNNERTIGNTQSRSHFGREINVTRGINQVDQVVVTVARHGLRQAREVFVRHFVEERNTSRLDGNATILLILTGIRQTRITGIFLRDDTRRSDERIRQRRFTVIDVCDNRHVTDVLVVVHLATELIDRKLHHGA
mmetsp:Transcript_5297/g.19284  ORF Transcript_5297/g.19284 Transcript_5297/m.19284 type:complete len:856 (+) Transcript_5297:61-2628(+)